MIVYKILCTVISSINYSYSYCLLVFLLCLCIHQCRLASFVPWPIRNFYSSLSLSRSDNAPWDRLISLSWSVVLMFILYLWTIEHRNTDKLACLSDILLTILTELFPCIIKLWHLRNNCEEHLCVKKKCNHTWVTNYDWWSLSLHI